MSINQTKNSDLLRLGGIAGIISGLFLPGVILQLPVSGWFPEYDLIAGTMDQWLINVSTNTSISLLGVGFSIIAILAFFPFVLTINQLLPKGGALRTASLAFQIAGTTLALAAFVFAFGFTWGLSELVHTTPTEEAGYLTGLATMGMRGFLATDDLATCLIGAGNGLVAWITLQNGLLPKWLSWWGIIGGILVTIVLLRFFIPILEIAVIGYPIVILWFVFVGASMLRMAKEPAKAQGTFVGV